jgi:hypothetical protein
MGVGYRARQFWQLIRAPALAPAAWRQIEAILTPAELALFCRFNPGDQYHSYAVLHTLQTAGESEPALLTAALLHDVGKTRLNIRVWERVAGSLGEIFFPRRARQWGSGTPRGWYRPFVIRCQHPAWGAELAAAAGSSLLTIALIRHHQDDDLSHLDAALAALLRRLQWADSQH